jgi:endothelin-converting enzyme/putative endopeptidase
MTRSRALTAIAIPLAIALTIYDDAHAQQPVPQPMVSRGSASGIDLAAIDKSASPCSDFYQYACGAWMTKHPAPPDQPRYGRFNELQDRNNEILRGILQDAMEPGVADPEMKKIGDYYQSCMSEQTIDAKGATPLEADMKRVDGIKTKAEIPAVVGHFQTVGTNQFFGFGAAPDFKNASQYILIYAEGGMGLPDRDYYLNDDANSTKIRGEYEQHIAKMLQFAGDTPPAAAAGAKTVVKIETALARASLDRASQRNPDNVYHKMPRDEVKKLMPNFNLSSFMELAEAPPGDSANVSEPEFLKAVDQVIASNSLADLKTYMRWHVVHATAEELPKKFDEENFNFYGKTLTGATEQSPRWKRCARAVDSDLGEALGKIYVRRTFGPEGKARTLEMVQNIEAAMSADIAQIDWMTPETKKAAEAKLRDVANKIGYPDKWRDYSSLSIVRGDFYGNSQRSNQFEYRREMAKIGKPVDKTEWLMTPPTVNAYYNPLENNINFPAGILQPPFFSRSADDAVNYGAAGAVVGHELTHGFDDQGRRFDGDGNLRDWWTADDGKSFENRALCIDKQYSGYVPVDAVHLNGKLTLGENTADNGGLRLAWMALMEKMRTEALGEVDGFSPEQRFFIGWAQMWCENRTDEVARLHAKTDPHSPGKFRANGVVSNMPEFAKAFSCQGNAPMVAQPVCRVW